MREQLLAYLFGQLEPDQERVIRDALARDPELSAELKRLRSCLNDDEPLVDPPEDLVEKTCCRLSDSGFPRPRTKMREAACSGAPLCEERSWTRSDIAVVIGIVLAAAMLLPPAIYESRLQSDRTLCQNQLQQLGLAIQQYMQTHNGVIPHVPESGNEAFAGIFAVRLADGGYFDRAELAQLLICPGTRTRSADVANQSFVQIRVPAAEQIRDASRDDARRLKSYCAGNYAYRFGYLDDWGVYRPWRIRRDTDLRRAAILADSPSLFLKDLQSANHGGHGLNVVFADGHVAYLCNCPSLSCGDHLFKNRRGERSAGIGWIDAVLGRSCDSPGVR